METLLDPTNAEFSPLFWTLLVTISLWELVWKGFALWKSAQNNQSGWFIALLIFNTVGILPILYLFVFGKHVKK